MGLEKRRSNFRHGQKLTSEWVNEIAKEVIRLGNISGSGGITIGNSSNGITIIGNDSGPEWRIAQAEIDPNSGYEYPSFLEYSDQSQVTTIYPFHIYNTTFDDETSWTPQLTGTPTQEYVYAYSLSGHYIPPYTVTCILKSSGKWYVDYTLPIMFAILDEDLVFESYASCTLEDYQIYYLCEFKGGELYVWDGLLEDGEMLAQGSRVAIAMWGTYPVAIAANKCATTQTGSGG